MEPEAIRLPVRSNFAAKISPAWPDSSITGACSALVRGPYHKVRDTRSSARTVLLTPLIRALFEALRRANAPSEELMFCLLTSIWDEPGSSSAGRFSADIVKTGLKSPDMETCSCSENVRTSVDFVTALHLKNCVSREVVCCLALVEIFTPIELGVDLIGPRAADCSWIGVCHLRKYCDR